MKEQVTTSGRSWSTNVSRSTHEVSRPLLTPDEAMRMKGARKNAQGMITEPGNMVIYVAGYPAIMGLQPLYFRDPELARRARIPAESAQTKKLEDTLASQRIKTPEKKKAGVRGTLLQADLERSSVFMDSSVSESGISRRSSLPVPCSAGAGSLCLR